MESLEYINLAVSKDAKKPTLCKPYRDVTSLYGCDGDRLHWIDGLPIQTPASYLDGSNYHTYPDVRHILPQGGFDSCATIVGLSKQKGRELEAFAKLYKVFACQSAECVFGENQLTISLKGDDGFAASLTIAIEGVGPFTLNLNLHYLIDALRAGLTEPCPVTVEFYGENKPITLTTMTRCNTIFHALISPMRA